MSEPNFEKIDSFNGKVISRVELEDYSNLTYDYTKIVAIYFTDGTKMRIETSVEHSNGQVEDLNIGVFML